MTKTVFKFTNGRTHMKVDAIQSCNNWSHRILFDHCDAALVRITNVQTQATVSVCGMSWLQGELITFSTLFVTKQTDGFDIEHTDNEVTVICNDDYMIYQQ